SVAHLRSAGRRVFLDAEHFFDGYKANPEFSLRVLAAAEEAGARRWFCATPTAAPCRTRSRRS
ncbi:MAG: hypothetical protein M3163_01550, partial [Actinomycetota bacterium]|nr:hypothetical protein [Actinomycetota bacterium]